MSLVFSNKNARDFGQEMVKNEKVSQNSRVAKKKSPERVAAAKVATRNRCASFETTLLHNSSQNSEPRASASVFGGWKPAIAFRLRSICARAVR